jgi:hypothetical protein
MFIQCLFGVCRDPSLHPVIFENRSLTLYIKSFSNLSTNIFMGFYFQSCRDHSAKGWQQQVHPMFVWGFIYGFAETPFSLHPVIFENRSLTLYIKSFSNLSSNIFMGFYFQSCRERGFLLKNRLLKGFYHSILLCNCIFTC